MKQIKTQDLARVFLRLEKKQQQQPKNNDVEEPARWRNYCSLLI